MKNDEKYSQCSVLLTLLLRLHPSHFPQAKHVSLSIVLVHDSPSTYSFAAAAAAAAILNAPQHVMRVLAALCYTQTVVLSHHVSSFFAQGTVLFSVEVVPVPRWPASAMVKSGRGRRCSITFNFNPDHLIHILRVSAYEVLVIVSIFIRPTFDTFKFPQV